MLTPLRKPPKDENPTHNPLRLIGRFHREDRERSKETLPAKPSRQKSAKRKRSKK